MFAQGMGKNKNTNLINVILSFKISQWKLFSQQDKIHDFFEF